MNKTSAMQTFWWGSFMPRDGQSLRWRIGPLTLVATYLTGEWQISWQYGEDDDTISNWEFSDDCVVGESLAHTSRYILGKTSARITVKPRLADRPIISRPKTAFNLIPGEETTVYVSSPLWLELATDNPAKKLAEFAVQRVSDTWFGPNTREGELCYATKTNCRLHLDELPERPHRAMTPVVIRNQNDTNLSLERLNLPAPVLPLYTTASGKLWTSRIILIRQQEGDMATLHIDEGPPAAAKDAALLSEPRQKISSSGLMRAFNALFN